MPSCSDLITLSALLMQLLPLAVAHPAPGARPSAIAWPRNWAGSGNGAISHGANGGDGDGWNGKGWGGHGGGQWTGGGGPPTIVTVTSDW